MGLLLWANSAPYAMVCGSEDFIFCGIPEYCFTTCWVWDVVDNVAVGWIPVQNVTMVLPVYHILGSLTRTIPSNMHQILGTVLEGCALPSSLGLKMRLVDGE